MLKCNLFLQSWICSIITQCHVMLQKSLWYADLNYVLYLVQRMSCVQELQLLEIMCSYFQEQSKDAIRQIIFSTLFSLQGNKADESRMAMLGKLVSMAIAVYRVPILECAATWLQVCNIRAFTLILSLLPVLMLKLQSVTIFQNVNNRRVNHECFWLILNHYCTL